MKKKNLQAIVGYMYKDELKNFERRLLDLGLATYEQRRRGAIPVSEIAWMARKHQQDNIADPHVFVHIQAIADFLDDV